VVRSAREHGRPDLLRTRDDCSQGGGRVGKAARSARPVRRRRDQHRQQSLAAARVIGDCDRLRLWLANRRRQARGDFGGHGARIGQEAAKRFVKPEHFTVS
jgi:hypothetical protein